MNAPRSHGFEVRAGHMIFPDPGVWTEHAAPDPVIITPQPEEPPDEVGGNVVDGTAHFLLITPDPGEPDLCGGCRREWEKCPHRVHMAIAEIPRPADAEEERLALIALKAVRAARGFSPDGRIHP